MTQGQGFAFAKRGLSLSKAFVAMGVLIASMGLLVGSVPALAGGLPTTGTGAPEDIGISLPLLSVALEVFAAILFATPVLLLYVYDKNNGVLEYFLSLGMDQADIYKQYLKAALILSSSLIAFEEAANAVVALLSGTGWVVFVETAGLLVALSIPVVAFSTMIMMSFSSLQKQRVGANQPLGMAIGVFLVMPAYIVPLVAPSLAVTFDVGLAVFAAGLALFTFRASSRLIRREKFLP